MTSLLKPLQDQSSSAYLEDQSKDLDLRLDRQIYMAAEMQQLINGCQTELTYCSQFLETLKK